MLGLKARHIEVSQSTLSRDIQELRLAKTGGVYAVVEGEPAQKPQADESWRRIHPRVPDRRSRRTEHRRRKDGSRTRFDGVAGSRRDRLAGSDWDNCRRKYGFHRGAFGKGWQKTRASDTRVTVAVSGHSSSSCRIGFPVQGSTKSGAISARGTRTNRRAASPGCGIVRPGCWTIVFP